MAITPEQLQMLSSPLASLSIGLSAGMRVMAPLYVVGLICGFSVARWGKWKRAGWIVAGLQALPILIALLLWLSVNVLHYDGGEPGGIVDTLANWIAGIMLFVGPVALAGLVLALLVSTLLRFLRRSSHA